MAAVRTTTRNEEARIGGGARVHGRIHGDGDLIVEGRVEGDVALRGNLTIAAGASVSSEIVEAHAVTIAGSLEGELNASGPVRLATGARVRGNLRGSAIAIDDGARFTGRLDCEFDLPPELGGDARAEPRGRASSRR